MKCETHDFYCLNCGKKGIPIMRKCSHLHKGEHRKKLFCPWCKMEVNHIECRTMDEIEKFKLDFAAGVYKEEALESMVFAATI